MRTRKIIPTLSRLALLMLVAGTLTWTGCDSNDDSGGEENNDSELLVGVWNATSIKAGPIDVLALAGVSMVLTLEADGDAKVAATDDGGEVSEIVGTYVVDESAKTITLDGDDVATPGVLPYTLIDDNTLSVEIDGSELADLGLDLGDVGEIVASLQIDVELARNGS